MDAMLLESVEGLGHSPFDTTPGEIWEALQAEREQVSHELLADGQSCQCEAGVLRESEACEEYALEIEWRHRAQLEARLRDTTEAQDRLIDGSYGSCVECAEAIDSKRLLKDPAAARCIGCSTRRRRGTSA